MNTMVNILNKLDQVLAKGEAAVLILLLSLMTVVVFLQVVFRYVLTQPLTWSEELARYLFVWLSVLGAALGTQKSGHFGLDFFYRLLPEGGKRLSRIISLMLIGAVVLVILIQGIVLVQKTRFQESPAMLISMAWPYAALPIGAGLMAFHLLVALIKEAKAIKRDERVEEIPEPGV
jgi:TRAP-type C4-dicarboxylate transport system permease small subunit